MKTSTTGIKLITRYEGFMAKPYLCAGGVPTIGHGTTYYPNGVKVTLQDKQITKEQAEEYFKENLKDYEKGVNKLVKAKINQNQFDALVSFAYNVGVANLQSSTLLKKVNVNPLDKSISIEFDKWIKSKGKVLQGLINRRKAESDLYFKPLS